MKIVSGKTGTPHVTSEQFRQIIEGTVGQGSYILTSGENLEPELASNNMLKIRGGMMSHHGNISCVDLNTYDEVTLTNGSQGVKRIDLIVNRYTRNDETGLEKNEWVVIIGTPDASNPKVPQHTIGNLQNGDLIDDCPVFEVHYDGINVTEVKKLLPVMSNLELLNGNIIVDMKEDEFLTNETYLGQPVYGKYIDIKKIAIQSYIPLNIPDSFFWIDTGNSYVYPISQNLDAMYPFPYVNPQDAGSSIRYALSKKNKSIMLFGGDWTGYGLYLLVKYYKY